MTDKTFLPRISNMPAKKQNNPLIVGLAGSFGSGCSYVAGEILKKIGFECVSLSDILKKKYKEETKLDPETAKRSQLQKYGDAVRKKCGADFFAKEALKVIKRSRGNKIVVDSIRNPSEVYVLRKSSPYFFLFGINANQETRWERVKEKYQGNKANMAALA